MRAKRLKALLRALLVVGAVAVAPADSARAQEFAVLHHERLESLRIVEPQSLPQLPGEAKATGPSLSFIAFGRQFEVALHRNQRLTRALSPQRQAELDSIELYEGALVGIPGSWARLTRHEGALSGVISDGVEIYAIEPFARAAPYLATPSGAAGDEPIIYRWSDTIGTSTDRIGAGAPSGPVVPRKAIQALAAELKSAISPGKQLDIGLIGDAAFVQQRGSANPAADLLAMANVVDGIFVTQVGIHLSVAEIELLDGATQPFTSADPQTLLEQLAHHKTATPVLRGQGLAHLFTGQNLQEPPGTPSGVDILGVANLGSLCDASRSVSVTQALSVPTAALIAAHEIGHNFGASHDGEPGSPCASSVGAYLMNPRFEGADTLSLCSIDQMLPVIAGATCLYDIEPSDLSTRGVTAPTHVLLGSRFDVDVAIDNSSVGDALGINVDFGGDGAVVETASTSGAFQPRFRCRFNAAPTPPECALHSMASGETLPVTVRSLATRPGQATVEVTVSSANDSNLLNNTHRFTIDVRPAVDIAIERFDASPPQLHPGEPSDLVVEFANRSTIPATQMEAHLAAASPMTIDSVSVANGTCRREFLATGEWHCPIGVLQPGGVGAFAARVRAEPQPMPPGTTLATHVRFELTAAEPDLNSRDTIYPFLIAPVISDLAVSMTDPGSVQENANVTFTVEGRNLGRDTVDNVTLDLESPGIAIDSLTSSGPVCPTPPFGQTLRCTFDGFAGASTFTIEFRGTAQIVGNHQLFARIRGATVDNDVFNDGVQRNLSVVAAPQPSPAVPPPSPAPQPAPAPAPAPAASGGGGGSADILFLAILAAGAVLRVLRTHLAVRRRLQKFAKHSYS